MSQPIHTAGPYSISHTPGSWRVAPIGSDTFVSADGETICDMLRNDCEDEEEIARCDANARLIATAPDLLDALKAMRDAYTRTTAAEERYGAFLRAVAAINKAEGKL